MTSLLNLKDNPEYREQLTRWHHDQWSCFNPGESRQQRTLRIRSHLNAELIPSTFITVDKELSVSVALVECGMESKQQLSPCLASVYAAPQYRRQSIGAQLVSHTTKQTLLGGIKTLYLFTPDLVHFYRRIGSMPLSNEIYRSYAVTVMHAVFAKLDI
jgi:N-acetylglutamate synthase-like GNAT family acetyltransferase